MYDKERLDKSIGELEDAAKEISSLNDLLKNINNSLEQFQNNFNENEKLNQEISEKFKNMEDTAKTMCTHIESLNINEIIETEITEFQNTMLRDLKQKTKELNTNIEKSAVDTQTRINQRLNRISEDMKNGIENNSWQLYRNNLMLKGLCVVNAITLLILLTIIF